jgi:hypothetical protein
MRLGRLPRAAVACCLVLLGHACGARTALKPGVNRDGGEGGAAGEAPVAGAAGDAPLPECVLASDCLTSDLCSPRDCVEGKCVELPVADCDDADPCTKDRCEPSNGACLHDAPVDADGDGYLGATTDFTGCGDDCDDSAAEVHPLATELCDGRDNDCDAAIDEGAPLGYMGFEPIRISGLELARAGRGGFARSGKTLGASYTGLLDSRWRSYFVEIDAAGTAQGAPRLINDINADTYAGTLAWTGEWHGTAWSDARQDANYEIYFNRLTAQGEKLGSDLRLSDAPNFSLHPTMLERDGGFLIVWDDRRAEDAGGAAAQLFGVLVDESGAASPELTLTDESETAEYPGLAATSSRVGLVYTVLDQGNVFARFRSFDLELGAGSAVADLGGPDAQDPLVTAVGERFIVTWQTYRVTPGDAIHAAVVGADGVVLKYGTPITSGASHARSHTMLSLGDRFVLIWTDDLDGNYELYSQTMDADLNVLRPRERITFDTAETLWPSAVLTDGGGIGVLFDDWRSGARQVYYTRLECTSQ